MNHELIREQLFTYYDGELSPAARSFVEMHLQDCVECREILDGWKQLSARILEPLEGKDSEAFVQQVMRRVRAYGSEPEGIRWPVFARWAYPALALSMAGFVAALVFAQIPANVSTETLLAGGQTASVAGQWLSGPPTEDQLLGSEVAQ